MSTRRGFIQGTVASAVSAILAPRVLARMGRGAITGAAPSGSLPSQFSFTPTIGSASASAGTFGQAFEQGAVPSGHYVTLSGANLTGYSVDPTNLWPDGSVKFARCDVTFTGTASTASVFTFGTTTTAPSGATVAEPGTAGSLWPSGLPNVKVAITGTSGGFSVASTYAKTYSLNSCIPALGGTDLTTWPGVSATAAGTAGRFAQILGVTCSEFVYFQAVDAHLAIWYRLKCYANGQVRVRIDIENGWFLKASPGQRDYALAIYISNGATPDYQSAGALCQGLYGEPQLSGTYYSSQSAAGATVNEFLGPPAGGGLLGDTDGYPGSISTCAYGATTAPSGGYSVGDLVSFGQYVYQCATANNGYALGAAPTGTTASNANWTYVSPVNVQFYANGTSGTAYTIAAAVWSTPAFWVSTTGYKSGQLTFYLGNIFASTFGEGASLNTGNTPPASATSNADWVYVATGGVGSFCSIGSYNYQCASAPTSGNAPTGSATSNAYWTYVASGELQWVSATGGTLPASLSSVYLIGHSSHTRVTYIGWYGNAGYWPVPAHDTAYYQNTRTIFKYVGGTPTSGAWIFNAPTGITASLNPSPFVPADVQNPISLSATGPHAGLGILNQWNSLYFTSGANPNAYNASRWNSNAVGKQAFFVRDEATGLPVNFINASYAGYNCVNFLGAKQLLGTAPPQVQGWVMQWWNIEHFQEVGFGTYLIEADYGDLEALQMESIYSFMQEYPQNRQGGEDGAAGFHAVLEASRSPYYTRGWGWTMARMAEASALTPTYLAGAVINGSSAGWLANLYALRGAFVQCIMDTFEWHNGTYVDPSVSGSTAYSGTLYGGNYKNLIGDIGQASNTGEVAGEWWGEQWEHLQMAIPAACHTVELAPEGVTNLSTDVIAVRNHLFNSSLPYWCSGASYAFSFRNTANEHFPYYTSTNYKAPGYTGGGTYYPLFMTVAQQWAAFTGYLSTFTWTGWTSNPGDFLCGDETQVAATADDLSYNYPANSVSAVVLAANAVKDLTYTAPAGFVPATIYSTLITAASNWSQSATNNTPQFAFALR